MKINYSQCLDDLEGNEWGSVEFNSSLIEKCYRLRKKPISEFTIEDLRVMIGQQIGLKYLALVALIKLKEDPMVSGDMYSGDLLDAVVSIPMIFWKENQEAYSVFEDIAKSALISLRNKEWVTPWEKTMAEKLNNLIGIY